MVITTNTIAKMKKLSAVVGSLSTIVSYEMRNTKDKLQQIEQILAELKACETSETIAWQLFPEVMLKRHSSLLQQKFALDAEYKSAADKMRRYRNFSERLEARYMKAKATYDQKMAEFELTDLAIGFELLNAKGPGKVDR